MTQSESALNQFILSHNLRGKVEDEVEDKSKTKLPCQAKWDREEQEDDVASEEVDLV